MRIISQATDTSFLLIQMRKHQGSEKAEYQNFLGHSGLNTGQLNAINLFEEPNFSEKHLDNYDGFFIGGFSDDPNDSLALTEEYFPFLGAFEQILNYAISIRKPGLLSCGGFMIASVLLGGEICLDESMQELDILSITRSDSEASDPVFQGIPKTFNIVSGHLKSTNILPPGCVLMASSPRCHIHVFKLKAAPIYAFQGHPEISAKEVKDRVGPYARKYFKTREEYEEFIAREGDTRVANGLLRRFVRMVADESF